MNVTLNGDTIFSTKLFEDKKAGLHDFLSLIKEQGLATHNTFRVEITIPRGLQNVYSGYGKTLELLCETSEFPAIDFKVDEVFLHGATNPRPTRVHYGDMFLFFLVEQNMKVKQFIDDWYNLIIDPEYGVVSFKEDYAVVIRIYQLDKEYNEVYCVELEDAFPRSTYPMQLNYSGTQFHRLPVQIAYRKWTRIDGLWSNANNDSIIGGIMSSTGAKILQKVAPVVYGLYKNKNPKIGDFF